jgi:large subunit ribosomal protein L10
LAITKERKEEMVAQYVNLLQNSGGFVLLSSTGMSVAEVNTVRDAVRKANGQYVVTKNTLLSKALEQVGWPIPEELLNGPTAIAFGLSDFPGVAKAVLGFTADKDAAKITVRGGSMPDSILSAKQVDTISKLPTMDELRAQLAGLIVAPATGLVSVIQAANSQVVNVIQAYLDDRKESGAA